MIVHLDFETYSEVSVKDVGAYAYARHPSTDIITLSYRIDDGPVQRWAPGLPLPEDIRECARQTFHAHNATFEREVWRHVGMRVYGFPPIPADAWRCSQAVCGYKAVALGLDSAAKMLGLELQKDKVGQAAMRYLSAPARRKVRGEDRYILERRHDFAREDACAAYCDGDVLQEVAVSARVGKLPPEELAIYQLDQEINARGVQIDTDLCEAAVEIARGIEERLAAEFRDLTGGLNPTQRDKVLEWLRERWVGFPDLQADTLTDMLALALPAEVRRALEIRQQTAKSSVKKYETALACVCDDGRARGMYQYHGAGTGRWAARLIQLQNMPRPSDEGIDMETLVTAIKTRDEEFLTLMYGSPMIALADATRGMVIPKAGHVLVAFDYSSIEAVVLACLAGEEWKIEAFRRKDDLYCLFAADIYGHTVTKKEHPDKRQTGKTGELAFGFAGGVGAWRKFDDSDRHTDAQVDEYKKVWRRRHPLTAGRDGLWNALDRAATAAVSSPGEAFDAFGCRYQVEGDWLACRIPSGRKLWYLNPRIELTEKPWGEACDACDGEGRFMCGETEEDCTVCDGLGEIPAMGPSVVFDAWKEGQIKAVRGWRGHWTENVVQALSRDILVSGMQQCDAAGYTITMHTHDELVVEVPEGMAVGAAGNVKRLMENLPEWATGWPIRAEGGILRRYQK